MDAVRPVFTAYFAHKPHFDYSSETYDCWVVFAATRGSFRYRIGKGAAPATAGPNELVLCPPGRPFYREAITPMTLYMIKFSGSHNLCAGTYHLSNPRRIRQDLQMLEKEAVCADPQLHPRLAHYCMDIFYQLCEDAGIFPQNGLAADSALKMVCEYIHCNLQAKLRTGQLASLSGYSEAHLISLFRKELRTTPGKYITGLRIAKAARLLTQTDTKIKDIAAACGFEDELYFSRVFKQQTGLCPTQYRACAKL